MLSFLHQWSCTVAVVDHHEKSAGFTVEQGQVVAGAMGYLASASMLLEGYK